MKRFILSLTVAAALFSGCTADVSNDEKLKTADEYLSEHGGEPGYRAAAYDLYKEVLEDPDNNNQAVRAHFGVGMIGFLDLVQGVPKLLEKPADGEESSGDMPPADALAKTIDALVHEVIDRGIVEHFDVVRKEKDFHFTFKSLVFPVTDASEKPIDLSGEWDLGEIGAIDGALKSAVGIVELAWAYNQVPETLLKVALSDADVPEMPSNPGEIPAWISDAATKVGFTKLPWLEKDWGTLKNGTDLEAIRARLDEGTQAIADAIAYTNAETDPQDDDVFPKSEYLGTVLDKLLQSNDPQIPIVGGVLDAAMKDDTQLPELLRRLHASIAKDDAPFLVPSFVWEVLGIIDSDKILDPVSMRLPGLQFGSLFTNPITDLKDTDAGLLPYFDEKGEFVLETEQEPYHDDNEDGLIAAGEYDDKGVDGWVDSNYDGVPDNAGWETARPGKGNNQWNDPLGLNNVLKAKPTNPPLGHKSPTGRMEPANDVVDQVYLFFGDASFGGFLVPTTTSTDPDEAYQVDTSGKTYENQDLMRLSSTIFWFASTQGLSL